MRRVFDKLFIVQIVLGVTAAVAAVAAVAGHTLLGGQILSPPYLADLNLQAQGTRLLVTKSQGMTWEPSEVIRFWGGQILSPPRILQT